jgi:hypothetical protein
MVFGVQGVALVAPGLFKCRGGLLVKHVRDALEEEHREDVSLEIRGVHGTAQYVRGFPEMVL